MEELSFVLALPLATAVSRLHHFVVVVVIIKLTYVIDIRLLLCRLDTANRNSGVRRHGCGVESPAGRLRRTKPVAWFVAEAGGPGVLRMSRRVLETPGTGDSQARSPPSVGRVAPA